MIALRNVSAAYKRADWTKPRRSILHDVSAVVLPGDHFAVLGGAGSGKTTLLRILCGLMLPTKGQIVRDSSVSFPVGFGGASGKMTVAQYIHFVAKCYAVVSRDLRDFVIDIADLDEEVMERKCGQLQSDIKARLNMALAYGLPFDFYVFDQRIVPADSRFRDRFLDLLMSRRETAGIILATREPRLARQLCRSGAVLHEGRLTVFGDIEEAISFYGSVCDDARIDSEDVYFRPM